MIPIPAMFFLHKSFFLGRHFLASAVKIDSLFVRGCLLKIKICCKDACYKNVSSCIFCIKYSVCVNYY